MVEVIHLDSCLLRGMLDSHDEAGNRTEAMHLLNSSPSVCFRVSILAVGEVMGKMAEARSAPVCAEAAAQLSRLFRRHRIELYGIGRGSEAMILAEDIMKKDHMIAPTDALLVACALVDDECTSFATTDRKLIGSIPLLSVAATRGLRIFDARQHVARRPAAQMGRGANMMLPQETSSGPTA